MSDLVGNPEDRFSHVEAQIMLTRKTMLKMTKQTFAHLASHIFAVLNFCQPVPGEKYLQIY